MKDVVIYLAQCENTVDRPLSLACFQQALALRLPGRRVLPQRSCDERGKPFLPQEPRQQFSVSHTGPWYAVAFALEEPLGLDIQTVRRGGQEQGIMRRFFTPQERQQVQLHPDPTYAFTRLWSKKEAIVKQAGLGIGGLRDCPALETKLCLTDLSPQLERLTGTRELVGFLASTQPVEIRWQWMKK